MYLLLPAPQSNPPQSKLLTACLSFISLTSSTKLSNTANRHADVLLVVFFGVYAYRDLWPLFTFDGKILDEEEGSILWLKIMTLMLAAIVIPVISPQCSYPPIDDVGVSDDPECTEIFSALSF